MINWRRIKSRDQPATFIKDLISSHLENGDNVLWLVPGGSAATIAVKAAGLLRGNKGLDRLNVCLTDERFGQPGHQDSNWQQLMDSGFDLKGAKLYPVLKGKDMLQTAEDYKNTLNELLSAAHYSLSLAGLGPDGHIFGIQPNSPAINSASDVESYEWEDYKRLTPTFNLLKKLDEIVIYAVGEEKRPQFKMLSRNISPADQPAQFLKRLKKVIILNDYKGEYL